MHVVAVSRVYETVPVGGPAQDDYLNAVAAIDTDLDPWQLLDVAHACEAHARRVHAERFGPRTLDVDILLFGDVEMDDPALTVPHPRMWQRDFVLAPLRDVAPDLVPDRGGLRSGAGRPSLIGSIGTPAGPVTGGVPEDACWPTAVARAVATSR